MKSTQSLDLQLECFTLIQSLRKVRFFQHDFLTVKIRERSYLYQRVLKTSR